MPKTKSSERNQFKSIFISDIHLGTRGCQAHLLNSFLKKYTADNLYLVGDIIDGWRLKKRFYWPQSHSDVIRRFLTLSKNGTNVIYIVGNHDEFLRKWLNFELHLGRVQIANQHDYISVNGERFLVVHGDMFDSLMKQDTKWIMHLGDIAYNVLIWVNTKFNKVRDMMGMDYWSLSKYLKSRTKQALSFIDGFEDKLASYARKRGYNGVICGHIHSANIKNIGDVQYINTGDWVESCTAVVETWDGEFKLIDWSKDINSK